MTYDVPSRNDSPAREPVKPAPVPDPRPLLRAAGVPAHFLAASFETFERRPGTIAALKAARRVAADQVPRNLLLVGPVGSGKTTLEVAVMRERYAAWLARYPEPSWEVGDRVALRPPLRQRFVVVPELLDRLRSAISHHADDDPVPDLTHADLLVLDDLGRERATDWASERLYVLVGARYNAGLPTLATMNADLDVLAARGYDALVSRLVQGAEVVHLTATDYRREDRT